MSETEVEMCIRDRLKTAAYMDSVQLKLKVGGFKLTSSGITLDIVTRPLYDRSLQKN